MVGGRLRCLGSVQHLKSRYGKGYTLELRTEEADADGADAFVLANFQGAERVERHGGQIRWGLLGGVCRFLARC